MERALGRLDREPFYPTAELGAPPSPIKFAGRGNFALPLDPLADGLDSDSDHPF